jgi:HEAT repeat protein
MFRFGEQAVPSLVGALEDRSSRVVFAAIMSLTEIGPPAAGAVSKLAFLAFAGPDDIRMGSVEALRNVAPGDEAALAVFLWSLRSPDDDLRQAAAAGLGVSPVFDRAMCRELVDCLADRCCTVRVEGARGLGKQRLFPEMSVPALAGGLGDEAWEVRVAAVIAIGAFGPDGADAFHAVLEIFSKEKEDSLRRMRSCAALTLSRIGSEQAETLSVLLGGLSHPSDMLKISCLRGIGNLGEKARPAVKTLIAELGSDLPGVRFEASRTLGKLFRGTRNPLVDAGLVKALKKETVIEVAEALERAMARVRLEKGQ